MDGIILTYLQLLLFPTSNSNAYLLLHLLSREKLNFNKIPILLILYLGLLGLLLDLVAGLVTDLKNLQELLL